MKLSFMSSRAGVPKLFSLRPTHSHGAAKATEAHCVAKIINTVEYVY